MVESCPERNQVAEKARKQIAGILRSLPVDPIERRVMAVGVVVAALQPGTGWISIDPQ